MCLVRHNPLSQDDLVGQQCISGPLLGFGKKFAMVFLTGEVDCLGWEAFCAPAAIKVVRLLLGRISVQAIRGMMAIINAHYLLLGHQLYS